jgi:hypothetical protein
LALAPWPAPFPQRAPERQKECPPPGSAGAGKTRKELVMSIVDHLIERGLLEYGPYNQVEFTDRAWPLCVAIMAALVLVAAYIEHGTVMVP